ncbi:MAG: hypothetical protein AAFW87_04650 [Pseudomonadota bacterium]
MPQHASNWIRAQDMVRSRTWRQGYESFRLGEPPKFDGHKSKCLSYEYGRLTAALLSSEGERLLQVPTTRPLYDTYVPYLAEALLRATQEQPAHAKHAIRRIRP